MILLVVDLTVKDRFGLGSYTSCCLLILETVCCWRFLFSGSLAVFNTLFACSDFSGNMILSRCSFKAGSIVTRDHLLLGRVCTDFIVANYKNLRWALTASTFCVISSEVGGPSSSVLKRSCSIICIKPLLSTCFMVIRFTSG